MSDEGSLYRWGLKPSYPIAGYGPVASTRRIDRVRSFNKDVRSSFITPSQTSHFYSATRILIASQSQVKYRSLRKPKK